MEMKTYLFIVLLVLSFTASSKQLSTGWELWYPYQYHNIKQQLVGLDFDSYNAIIYKAGFKTTYTELPWKRHLQYIKTGEMDIAMGSSYTKEREKYAYFSKPYRKETVKLFVKKGMADKIFLKSLADLSATNYMIGVEGGYYYGKEYQRLISNPEFKNHINEVLDIEQNVTMILKGHLDGFLVDPITMKAFTDKYSMQDEFETHEVEIYQADIHIMLSRKSCTKEMLNKINAAIDELKENGELQTIIDNWTKLQSK